MEYVVRKGKLQIFKIDRLIYVLKSISFYNLKARDTGLNEEATDRFILDVFFANFS